MSAVVHSLGFPFDRRTFMKANPWFDIDRVPQWLKEKCSGYAAPKAKTIANALAPGFSRNAARLGRKRRIVRYAGRTRGTSQWLETASTLGRLQIQPLRNLGRTKFAEDCIARATFCSCGFGLAADHSFLLSFTSSGSMRRARTRERQDGMRVSSAKSDEITVMTRASASVMAV
ncbi:MAG: hypothetical protein RLZZ15_3604 [Verrucomicrobiota bacterium]